MRFVMLMIPDIYQGSDGAKLEAFAPSAEAVAAMTKYNEELAKAGALISIEGLHPLSEGARVRHSGGTVTVTDGPFTEAKEVVGGYWMIQVASKEEAIEWARRVPEDGCTVEIRQVFEMSELPAEVQEAGDSAVLREHLAQSAD
jgi:hypothetical protein